MENTLQKHEAVVCNSNLQKPSAGTAPPLFVAQITQNVLRTFGRKKEV